jgi:sugar phosphate isomerase/epimerase
MKKQLLLNRRDFMPVAASVPALGRIGNEREEPSKPSSRMRLGGPVQQKYRSPEEWIDLLQGLGYNAAYCPVADARDETLLKAYMEAARKADIVIAETGAWSNPMAPDEKERKQALEKCKTQLDLADRIGARCCVNISGSRGNPWDGHSPLNLTPETFDRVVETTRSILDAVKPTRTFYALETMPWSYPDSVDSYLRLIKAMDRKQFATHLDPVNLVSSPQLYYRSGELIRDCFKRLGPYIKSCHAKDITMSQKQNVHLDEIIPGQGNLDYRVYLQELRKLGDVPLMIEHLRTPEEYKQAADYIRSVARETGWQAPQRRV